MISENLKILADKLAAAQGNYILEFKARVLRSQLNIEIILDRMDGGVTIDHCADLNKQFCRRVDEDQMVEGDYTVQVASPGLDRPLHQAYEFRRRLNKEIRVHLNTAVEGKKEYQGVVREVTDDRIQLEAKAVKVEIPLSVIHFGKQII